MGQFSSWLRTSALLGASVLVLAAGCSAEHPQSGDEPQQLPSLELGDQPEWTAAVAPDTALSVEIRGDAVIAHHGQHLEVVDAATGAARWALDEGDLLPLGGVLAPYSAAEVVGSADDWSIVVQYAAEHDGSSPESGIVVLDDQGAGTQDAMIVPSAPLNSPTSEIEVSVTDADDALIAVSAAPDAYAIGSPGGQDQIRTVGVGTNTGDILWDQAGEDGQWSVAVTDNSVLAVESAALPLNGDPDGPTYEGSTVVGLDRSTGYSLWKLDDHAVRAAVGGYAVVTGASGSESGQAETVVLDASSGVQVADLGTSATWCRDDESAAACLVEVGSGSEKETHLVTFDSESATAVTSEASLDDDATITGLADGYAFVTYYSGAATQTYAIDPTGKDPSGPYPGSFEAMSDEYVVFATYDGTQTGTATGYAVYERQ